MDPQDYSDRTRYRPPSSWYARLNRLGVPLTSLGLAPRDAVTLAVRGRLSGRLRRLPILKTTVGGSDYLVSLAGESQWVRNVRAAAGQVTITRRRKIRAVLEELEMDDRPPILAAYLDAARNRSSEASYAKQLRFYFGFDETPSEDQLAAIAHLYPVFLIRPVR